MTSRVYEWGFSAQFAVFEPGPNEPDDLFDKRLISIPYEEWGTPEAVETFEIRGRPAPLGDFPGTTGFMHLLSPRAMDAVGQIFATFGNLYPVHIRNEPPGWHLYSQRHVVDCLDLAASTVGRLPWQPSRICTIEKPVFVPTRLPDGGLFVVPECSAGTIYICDDIAALINRHKLEGFVLDSAIPVTQQ